MRLEPPVCVALDVPSLAQARELLRELADLVPVFKVGLELFASCGPAAVDAVRDTGADVLLDLKVHDVPRTAAAAVGQAARIGASMLTVHGLGGRSMLRACVEASRDHGGPRILAVTVLTSHDEDELAGIGVAATAMEQAKRIGRIAAEERCDGLVLSPRELAVLRSVYPELLLATPGIRPEGVPPDDQRRVLTPAEAILAGTDLCIVGRPVLNAANRRAATQAIIDEVRLAGAQHESRRPFDEEASVIEAEDAEIVPDSG